MARKYVLEQSQSWGSQQRALDRVGADMDALETDVESYSPGTSADWAAPAPTTQDDALDRIAAAVAGLLGTPIP